MCVCVCMYVYMFTELSWNIVCELELFFPLTYFICDVSNMECSELCGCTQKPTDSGKTVSMML